VPPVDAAGNFGWHGVVHGAAVIFFAYIGFDAVSTAAQEAKNPQRDMPIGLLGSLGFCTIIYIVVSLILTGMVNYKQLNVEAPIAFAINLVNPSLAWLKYFITIGAIAGLSSVILVLLLGQARIFYAMSRDGLLPPIFSAVHAKFKTPWLAQLLIGVLAMLIAGLFPIGLLGELVSIGTLLAFSIVCVGVFVLRFTDPNLKRPFRTPIFWFVAPAGVASCVFLMVVGLPADTWARLIVWIAIGIVIYFAYSHRHSKLHHGLLGKAKPAPGKTFI
jgi:APA family basic amino acid/polyamine antiporter